MMSAKIELTGQVFHRFTVLAPAENNPTGQARWLCRCRCGQMRIVAGRDLRIGKHRSCGCLAKETSARQGRSMRRHGMCNTGTYKSWNAMLDRVRHRSDYGGRGITACVRWLAFENFLADMGERPKNASIGRIDNDGNYEPSNCRWEVPAQQMNNRRNTQYVTAFGETKALTLWFGDARCAVVGATFRNRIRNGWSPERALTAKPDKGWRRKC